MPDSLTLHEVSKRYGQDRFVIESLSHTFAPGTATGLVGPNGSGKTTLLRMLSVLSYPTSGRITYGNLDIHEHPHVYLRATGIVHDGMELPQYLSAVEATEYVLRARGLWSEAARARAAALFDALMLDERRDNLIGAYSSGMLRKAQIALALSVEPSLLLMDEPFRGLDEDSTAAALRLLMHFKNAGGLIIVSSHLKVTLESLCTGILRFPIIRQPVESVEP